LGTLPLGETQYRKNQKKIAYYVVFCRREIAFWKALARVAGTRWQIETGFETAKGLCGLDLYEVRKWDAWYRHMTLSLLSHAFLAGDACQGKALFKRGALLETRSSV